MIMADTTERLEGAKFFAGPVTFTSITLPTGPRAAIGNTEIKDGANIEAAKLRRRMALRARQGNVAAVAETGILHTAYGAVGEVKAIRYSHIGAATGGGTVTLDVKKNGVTILVASLVVTAALAAYGTAVANVVATPANGYVAGDVFTYHITVAAGGGTLPTGIAVEMITDEDPN
jgi:hypothetical protein